MATKERGKINSRVANNLREALSWCSTEGAPIEVYDKIKSATDHDRMVREVKKAIAFVFRNDVPGKR
jgi:hypothetical protein